MIEISFLTGMLLVCFGWLVFRGASYSRRKRIDWKDEAKQLFFLVNLLVITRFTFYPFSTVNGQVQPLIFDVATVFPLRVNLVPFLNLLDYESRSDLLINLIGNFAMFIPSGIMLPLIYPRFNNFPKVALAGIGLSLIIEVIQLPFAVRASDVDDLILNTLGCMAGYGLYALVRGICRRVKNL